MSKIAAIAYNTFREAVRNKILYILFVFAAVLIIFSTLLGDLSITASDRIIKNLGLAAIDIFGMAIAILVGGQLIYNEMEKKTIYTIVSKPIDRYQFVLGKYFGLLLTIAVNVVIMSFLYFCVVYYQDATSGDKMMKAMYKELSPGKYDQVMTEFGFITKAVGSSIYKGFITLFGYVELPTQELLKTILMSFIGMAMITAFATLYSTFSTPTLSAIFTTLTVVIGQLCEDLLRYADRLALDAGGVDKLTGNGLFKYWFCTITMHVTPNLSIFNRRTEVVFGNWDAAQLLRPKVDLFAIEVIYGVVYIAGILCIASMTFARRNFK